MQLLTQWFVAFCHSSDSIMMLALVYSLCQCYVNSCSNNDTQSSLGCYLVSCCDRYNSRTRKLEHSVLRQGLELPEPPMTSSEPLPAAQTLLDEPLQAVGAEHAYCLPPNTAGQAAQSQRRRPSAGPGGRQLFPVALPAAATTAAVTSASPQSTVVSVTDTDLPVATVSVTEVPVTLLPKTTYYRYKKNRGLPGFIKNTRHITLARNVVSPAQLRLATHRTGGSCSVQARGRQKMNG